MLMKENMLFSHKLIVLLSTFLSAIFYSISFQLQCIGRIYDIYYGEDTRVIEEEKIPQVFSPSLSYLSEDKQGKHFFNNIIWMFYY